MKDQPVTQRVANTLLLPDNRWEASSTMAICRRMWDGIGSYICTRIVILFFFFFDTTLDTAALRRTTLVSAGISPWLVWCV